MKPKSQTVAVFKMKSFDNVLETLKISKKKLGGFLSAIEYMDEYSMNIVEDQLNKPAIFAK